MEKRAGASAKKGGRKKGAASDAALKKRAFCHAAHGAMRYYPAFGVKSRLDALFRRHLPLQARFPKATGLIPPLIDSP